MIQSAEKILETLKTYQEFPRKLAKYKYALAEYIGQIIYMIDCIIDILGGWFERNRIRAQKYIEVWYTIKAIMDIFKEITLIYK